MSDDQNVNSAADTALIRKLEQLGFSCESGLSTAIEQFQRLYNCDTSDTWSRINELAGSTFVEIFQFELDALDKQSNLLIKAAEPALVFQRAHESSLVGLALSGNDCAGIGYGWGVVSALKDSGIYKEIDYLSSVGSGGLLAGWLTKSSLEKRNNEEHVGPLPDDNNSRNSEEASYTRLLRKKLSDFANGDLPRKNEGRIAKFYISFGLIANLVNILAWTAVVLTIPRLIEIYYFYSNGFSVTSYAIFFLLIGSFLFCFYTAKEEKLERAHRSNSEKLLTAFLMCLPLCLAAFYGASAIVINTRSLNSYYNSLPSNIYDITYIYLLIPAIIFLMAWGAGTLFGKLINIRNRTQSNSNESTPVWIPSVINDITSSMVCGIFSLTALTWGILWVASSIDLEKLRPLEIIIFGAPTLLLSFAMALAIILGLTARNLSENSLHRWVSQVSWIIKSALIWLACFSSAYYLPGILDWLWKISEKKVTIGSVITATAAVLSFKFGGGKIQTFADLAISTRGSRIFSTISSYFVLLIAVSALSYSLHYFLTSASTVENSTMLDTIIPSTFHESRIFHIDTGKVISLWLLVFFVSILLAWRIELNFFSAATLQIALLKSILSFRLSGSRKDVMLQDLLIDGGDVGGPQPSSKPYHIINCAVMASHSEKGELTGEYASFVFTPAFSGFEYRRIWKKSGLEENGSYRATADYATQKNMFTPLHGGISLTSALAISCQSKIWSKTIASPSEFGLKNLFYTSFGQWYPSTLTKRSWKRGSTRFGFLTVIERIIDQNDFYSNSLLVESGSNVDGLGIYELVRRRCLSIISVDCSTVGLENRNSVLEKTIERCWDDFGIRIEMDPPAPSDLSGIPIALRFGTIFYHEPSPRTKGTLVIIGIPEDTKGAPLGQPTPPYRPGQSFETYRRCAYAALINQLVLRPPPTSTENKKITHKILSIARRRCSRFSAPPPK